jgi:hypothetical protein
MELVIAKEKEKLKNELQNWFNSMKKHLEVIPMKIQEQIKLLENIRATNYEELNQIQHALAVLSVAEELQKEFSEINKWNWHPKQTSDKDLADLTGYINGEIFLNAEITTSLKPIGTIDKRMKNTLVSLNEKSGIKFYFVRSIEMKKRANTKITKANWDIKVRIIN